MLVLTYCWVSHLNPTYLAEMRKYEVIFGRALNIGGLIDCYGVEVIKVIIKSRKIVNLILDHGRVDEQIVGHKTLFQPYFFAF